jgi:hypothetical protein
MARPPLGLMPGFRPPMMMPGMMGMGPMMGGIGGIMPGMMGGFNPNAIPGRFGRDVLGRQFAGPGGIGHSRVRSQRNREGGGRITDARFCCSLIDRLIRRFCLRCRQGCRLLRGLRRKGWTLMGAGFR